MIRAFLTQRTITDRNQGEGPFWGKMEKPEGVPVR